MKKILVIDDEDDIRHFLGLVLEEKGYRVRTAAGGEEGLRLARADPPDLVLLDIMMPVLDGWEVLRRLKRYDETAGIPVALVSARTDRSDPAYWRERGAVEFIGKPFSLHVLLARIEELLAEVGERAKAGA